MQTFLNHFFDEIDPFRCGPLFTHYGFFGVLFIAAGTYLMHQWIVSPDIAGLGGPLQLFSIGVHEAGHPIFRFLFFKNHFMIIIGGTFMELFVPLAAYLFFLRRGKAIQADVCLLLLSIACWSVGHYAGFAHDDVIRMLNADANTLPDWEYMHTWFHTWPYDNIIRHGFYWISAFLAALGTCSAFVHFWKWTDPNKYTG